MSRRLLASLVVGGLITALLVGYQVAPSGETPNVIAEVGDVSVTAEDFRSYYVDYLLKSGQQDHARLRKAFLDNVIASRLLIQQTRKAGIEDERAYRFQKELVRRKLLLDAYAHRVLYDTLRVTEHELAQMFQRINTQVKARHLYARTREQAQALYARLQAGETFEALAQEVFADPALASNGGSLGYFSFDEMDPAFEEAAFTLEVGAISTPVRTAQGYSIIQVDDRFTKPLLTETEFAKKRDKLRRYVLYRKRETTRRQHSNDLASTLDLRFHEKALGSLLGQVTGTNVVAGGEAFQTWLTEPLVSFRVNGERQTWTVEDFRRRARFTSEEQRAQVRTRADLVNLIQGLVVRAEMLRRAEARQLDEQDGFAETLRKEMDEWVLEQARERMVEKVTVPEDSIRAHFERHPKEFVMPYDGARDRIAEQLRSRYARAYVQQRYRSIRSGREVTIDENALYSMQLTEQQP